MINSITQDIYRFLIKDNRSSTPYSGVLIVSPDTLIQWIVFQISCHETQQSRKTGQSTQLK